MREATCGSGGDERIPLLAAPRSTSQNKLKNVAAPRRAGARVAYHWPAGRFPPAVSSSPLVGTTTDGDDEREASLTCSALLCSCLRSILSRCYMRCTQRSMESAICGRKVTARRSRTELCVSILTPRRATCPHAEANAGMIDAASCRSALATCRARCAAAV
jgi:hypothetical protein